MGERKQQLTDWLRQQTNTQQIGLIPLKGGASFRRFFRFTVNGQSYIAMDAPPDREDSERYVALTEKLTAIGLAIPQIFAADTSKGFIWLADFGDQLYFNHLNCDNVDKFYRRAFVPLLKLQQATLDLPAFDYSVIHNRLAGFHHTFIQRYLGLTLSQREQQIIDKTFTLVSENVLQQPQVPVHYDYHSQNLLNLGDGTTGIVDFQDAQQGPITYDLVSLLRDCYVQWPIAQVRTWVADYYQQLQQQQLIAGTVSLQQFNEWFDLTGIKRHLRVCFVFARKWLRDDDASYLQYLPRALNYIDAACQPYPPLRAFQQLLQQRLLPALEHKKKVMQ
ncbi:MAG: phosphotransferase [Gammaproteobacteria bacterium]|nr:phosphotransferase [Gammaproteobacteria bacterium]